MPITLKINHKNMPSLKEEKFIAFITGESDLDVSNQLLESN
jgi:hypothetical protein